MDARRQGIVNYLELFADEDLGKYSRQLGLSNATNRAQVIEQIADRLYGQGYEVANVSSNGTASTTNSSVGTVNYNEVGKLNRWSNQYGSGYVPDLLDARGDGHSLIGANNNATNSVTGQNFATLASVGSRSGALSPRTTQRQSMSVRSPGGTAMGLGSWATRNRGIGSIGANSSAQANGAGYDFKLPEVFDQTGYNRWGNQYGSGVVHDSKDRRGENAKSLSNLVPFKTAQGQQVLNNLQQSGALKPVMGSSSNGRSRGLSNVGSMAISPRAYSSAAVNSSIGPFRLPQAGVSEGNSQARMGGGGSIPMNRNASTSNGSPDNGITGVRTAAQEIGQSPPGYNRWTNQYGTGLIREANDGRTGNGNRFAGVQEPRSPPSQQRKIASLKYRPIALQAKAQGYSYRQYLSIFDEMVPEGDINEYYAYMTAWPAASDNNNGNGNGYSRN